MGTWLAAALGIFALGATAIAATPGEDEAGKRSIFLGKFGEEKTENVFVTTTDLCGPAEKLF